MIRHTAFWIVLTAVALLLLAPVTAVGWEGPTHVVAAATAQQPSPTEVSFDVHHDVSPPLLGLSPKPRSDRPREIPLRRTVAGAASAQRDGVVQFSTPTNTTTRSGLNFAGVGY